MKRMFLAVSAFFLLTSFRPAEKHSPRMVVTHLRCEYLTNPLGIDVPQPRLSWVLNPGDASARGRRQTAYRIVVAKARKSWMQIKVTRGTAERFRLTRRLAHLCG